MTDPFDDIGAARSPMELPTALTALNRWLVWRLIPVAGKKARKVPYYARSGQARSGDQGSPDDKAAMSTFDVAMAACKRGRYEGAGLALLGDGIVALDFDDCIVDGKVDSRVMDLVLGTYAEISPSGNGVRAFFKGDIPDNKDNKLDSPFKVEFFCRKGFVTLTGNRLPECDIFGSDVMPLTDAVRKLHAERFGGGLMVLGASAGGDDDWFAALGEERIEMDLGQARELLKTIDPNCSYQDWLQDGQALHQHFNGSVDALNIWDEWSKGGTEYPGRREIEYKWSTFGKGSGPKITAARLLRRGKDSAVRQKYSAADEWKKAISDAQDEFALRERVCTQIAKDDRLGDIERDTLANVLAEKFKSLGTKHPLALCRKLVAEYKVRSRDRGLPEWAKGWVYVTDQDQFFKLDSAEWMSVQGFNASHNRELEDDSKTASWFALENLRIATVTRGVYLPWAESEFELDGVRCVNTYRPSSVPDAVSKISRKGREAIEIVEKHIRMLCGGREAETNTLISFIAHNVQKPGVKIRWAPLIKGIQGDGKSTIGTLMAAVMGRTNVKNVSPKVLGTDFTGWAQGAAVAVLEEIKLTGHNRYDILNALKPFVTNDSVEIHPKGKDPHESINVTNYIAFTNYSDALPLDDDDRRWWVIFTPFADRASVAAAVGDLGAYFKTLNDAIVTQRAELRRWLLDWPIDAFQPDGNAPETEEKLVMIGMSVTDEESTIKDVIAEGGYGISNDVLSSSCLTNALALIPVVLATTALNRALTKCGYTKLPKKVKWRKAAHHIWVRGRLSWNPAEIRDALDKTVDDDPFFDSEPF